MTPRSEGNIFNCSYSPTIQVSIRPNSLSGRMRESLRGIQPENESGPDYICISDWATDLLSPPEAAAHFKCGLAEWEWSTVLRISKNLGFPYCSSVAASILSLASAVFLSQWLCHLFNTTTTTDECEEGSHWWNNLIDNGGVWVDEDMSFQELGQRDKNDKRETCLMCFESATSCPGHILHKLISLSCHGNAGAETE